ncbi:MAG TPA: hypothetical protein DDY77_01605 [Clostridiales bacterium]|nr:hypothetical protein [Clostridiales bacterium]
MRAIGIAALAVIAAFYAAYFTKMFLQKRNGVKTNQMGKGNKPKKVLAIETIMKIATYSVVAAEVFSVIFDFAVWRSSYAWIGIGVAAVGVSIFVIAMITMRDSWRAGIPAEDKTKLVTTGIYRVSRNPAFLGFDLTYIGLLISFFNYIHLLFVVFAVVMLHLQILQEEKFLTATFGESYVEYKKRTGRYFVFDRSFSKKKTIAVCLAVVLCVAGALGGFMIYGTNQMKKLPELSFRQSLEYTTKNNPDAVITVGVIKDWQTSYKVYRRNGVELDKKQHIYEIGSLTKTFTAALVAKAVKDGKIAINDHIDGYLNLPGGKNYPTIAELLTHTSGYNGYYFEAPMIFNFLVGRNDFYGVNKKSVLERAGKIKLDKKEHAFNYSNYGFAVLGLILENVYGKDYTLLLNDFVKNELRLENTKISDGKGDLENYWAWKAGDAYIPAGAITSNITDMLSYAELLLKDDSNVSECVKPLKRTDAATESYKAMGIGMDSIGMAWIIDEKSGITWHNGGTGNFNSYLGFDKESGVAVVILSNLAPSYRIPATVLGVKLINELRA